MELVLLIGWLVLAGIIAAAAGARGRGPAAWFFVSLLFSPIIAALLLMAFPAREVSEVAPGSEGNVLDKVPSQGAASSRDSWGGLIAVFAIICAVGLWLYWAAPGPRGDPVPPSAAAPAATVVPPEIERHARALLGTELKLLHVGSEYGLVTVRLAIANKSNIAVKDLRVACSYYGESGTLIRAVHETIYQSVPPGAHKTVALKLGFAPAQTRTVGCAVDDLIAGD